jgi:hypothetical protein
MLEGVGIIYLVVGGVLVGISIGLSMFVTFITLGSKDGMDLAGKMVLDGVRTAALWPIVLPYRMVKSRFEK